MIKEWGTSFSFSYYSAVDLGKSQLFFWCRSRGKWWALVNVDLGNKLSKEGLAPLTKNCITVDLLSNSYPHLISFCYHLIQAYLSFTLKGLILQSRGLYHHNWVYCTWWLGNSKTIKGIAPYFHWLWFWFCFNLIKYERLWRLIKPK